MTEGPPLREVTGGVDVGVQTARVPETPSARPGWCSIGRGPTRRHEACRRETSRPHRMQHHASGMLRHRSSDPDAVHGAGYAAHALSEIGWVRDAPVLYWATWTVTGSRSSTGWSRSGSAGRCASTRWKSDSQWAEATPWYSRSRSGPHRRCGRGAVRPSTLRRTRPAQTAPSVRGCRRLPPAGAHRNPRSARSRRRPPGGRARSDPGRTRQPS